MANLVAIHPPHVPIVEITLNIVITFIQGGTLFIAYFALSSNYTISKCLSHEGKATVTQLQIHKKT